MSCRVEAFSSFFLFLVIIPASALAQESKPATLEQIHKALDWSQLPKPDDASRVTSGLSTCSYSTKLTFTQLAEFLKKKLPEKDWAAEEPTPGVDLSQYLYVAFDKAGMHLSISGYKDEMSGLNRITMQNSGNVDVRKFPKLPGATYKSDSRSSQYYFTTAKPEEVAAFYRKELPPLGWREVEDPTAKFHAKEGRTILRFQQNAMEITVVCWVNKEKQTEATCSTMVRNSFEPDQVKAAFCAKEMATPANLKEYLKVIDLRKLPRMDKAQKLDRDQKMAVYAVGVNYQAPGTVDDAAKFYRKVLSEQGWKEISAQNEIDKMITLKFEKGGYLVTVDGSEHDKPGFVTVGVTNHSNVDLRQLPYPAGAEIYPGRDTHVNLNTSLTKDAAFEFYRKELPKLGWKEAKSIGQGTMLFEQNAVDLQLEIGTDSNERTSVQIRAVLHGIE